MNSKNQSKCVNNNYLTYYMKVIWLQMTYFIKNIKIGIFASMFRWPANADVFSRVLAEAAFTLLTYFPDKPRDILL